MICLSLVVETLAPTSRHCIKETLYGIGCLQRFVPGSRYPDWETLNRIEKQARHDYLVLYALNTRLYPLAVIKYTKALGNLSFAFLCGSIRQLSNRYSEIFQQNGYESDPFFPLIV